MRPTSAIRSSSDDQSVMEVFDRLEARAASRLSADRRRAPRCARTACSLKRAVCFFGGVPCRRVQEGQDRLVRERK